MARDSDCRAYTADPGVLEGESTNEASEVGKARYEAIRGKARRQMAFTFIPGGLCDYWYRYSDVSCGLTRREYGGVGWSGPLCAKCDELRSWVQQYLARDS